MASDPITWRNMRPISIADELMAYAKYSGGAGDALKGMGTTIDDLLQAKSTRDTEAFLAGADDLPTAEARNAALQQAREGFNLINVGQARKGLRASQVHDWAGEQRAEQKAQAADLLLTQKSKRDDIIADNLRADRRNKQLMLNEVAEAKRANEQIVQKYQEMEAAEEQFRTGQAWKEQVHKDITVPEFKDRQELHPLTMAAKQLQVDAAEETAEERQRIQANKELVRDQHAVVQSVLDNPALDRLGKPEGGPEAAFKNLEDIIQDNINNDVEQASLIDRYQRYLEDNVLTTITQADIDVAFGKGKKITYTESGRKRLESAIYKRLRKQYKVNTPTISATLKTMATGAVAQSPEHADKFGKPLMAAHKKMQAAKKGDKTSTYVAERDYLLANHTAEDVAAFDKEHRSKALRDITIDLSGLTSKSPTPRTYDAKLFKILGLDTKVITEKNRGRPVLDENGQQITDLLPIIYKQPGDIDQTDLDNIDAHVFDKTQELHSIPNLTGVESQKIGKRSLEEYPGLGRRLSRAKRTISTTQDIFDITQTAEKETVTAEVKAKAEATTEDTKLRAAIGVKGGNINKNVVPLVSKYFKDNIEQETWTDTGILDKKRLTNDVGRLKEAILDNSNINAADTGVIIKNYLTSGGNTTIDTWGYNELMVDTDADGVGDTLIRDLASSEAGKIELFRLAMSDAAQDNPKFEDVLLNFDINDLNQKITGNKNQIKAMSPGAKAQFKTILEKLNNEIKDWEAQLTEKKDRQKQLVGK